VEDAKIQFSPAEMDLMCNAGIILTKNRILAGIRHLLEGLQQHMEQAAYLSERGSLSEMFRLPAKISKGENYLGLPYLVLDYPRHFESRNIFAVRTLFWWGHSFSSTLHLSGDPKEAYGPALAAARETLSRKQYYAGINEEDPWQHHFEEDNYRALAQFSEEAFATHVTRAEHLKIAAAFPLRDIHFVAEDLLESWKRLLGICGMSFREY